MIPTRNFSENNRLNSLKNKEERKNMDFCDITLIFIFLAQLISPEVPQVYPGAKPLYLKPLEQAILNWV